MEEKAYYFPSRKILCALARLSLMWAHPACYQEDTERKAARAWSWPRRSSARCRMRENRNSLYRVCVCAVALKHRKADLYLNIYSLISGSVTWLDPLCRSECVVTADSQLPFQKIPLFILTSKFNFCLRKQKAGPYPDQILDSLRTLKMRTKLK
jgi:hypothetical protein